MRKIFYFIFISYCVILTSCKDYMNMNLNPYTETKNENIETKNENIVCSNGELTVYTNKGGMLYSMFKQKYADGNGTEELGTEEWNYVKSIVITGVIDARDFSTIKWNFRNVEYIDISNTKIIAYEGEYGTNEGYYEKYDEDTIPFGAFFYWTNHVLRGYEKKLPDEMLCRGLRKLKEIKLPNGIKMIDDNAFRWCDSLENVNIPEGVIEIGPAAFRRCESMKTITLPSTLKIVGHPDGGVFTDMYSLKEVHMHCKEIPIGFYVFGDMIDMWNYEMFNTNFRPSEYFCYVSDDESCYHRMTNATLFVPKGYKNNFNEWCIHFNNIVEEDV